MNRTTYCFLTLVLWCTSGVSQTTLNPDLSAVGEFLVFSHNDDNRPNESGKFNMSNPDMELNIRGHLNPYARADAVIAWEGEENAVVEEFYATILRGIPLHMNLRAGKYRLEFGRLNPVHPHAYSFINLPLVHEVFFGEEGLNDVAIRASVYLPTGAIYTELMAAISKGNVLLEEDALADDDTTHIDPGVFGRLTTSLATTETAELSLGASFFNSVHDIGQRHLRSSIIGGDIKYKDVRSRYTTLLLEGEFLYRSQQHDSLDNLISIGAYAYLDYRFNKVYNIGGMFDYTRVNSIEIDSGGKPLKTSTFTWRGTLFTGFAPIEETSLVRLAGHWTKPDNSNGLWELAVQLVFSLGPHKPHNF